MHVSTTDSAIMLVGHLDGRCSAVLRDRLYRHIHEHPDDDVVVDVSGVESIDLTALRLLAAAALRMERTGRHIVLRGSSPAVRRVVMSGRWRRFFVLER